MATVSFFQNNNNYNNQQPIALLLAAAAAAALWFWLWHDCFPKRTNQSTPHPTEKWKSVSWIASTWQHAVIPSMNTEGLSVAGANDSKTYTVRRNVCVQTDAEAATEHSVSVPLVFHTLNEAETLTSFWLSFLHVRAKIIHDDHVLVM